MERVHQTLGNIIRTFTFEDLDEEYPWNGILAAAMFSICATVSTTTTYTPMQMVFGRVAILNIQHTVNWKMVKKRKQDLINKNNGRENSKRIKYTYTPGEKVLIGNDPLSRAKYDKGTLVRLL